LRTDAAGVLQRLSPAYEHEYQRRGWTMLRSLDRVYDNTLARRDLAWQPQYSFDYAIARLRANEEFRSPLAIAVGAKGYHSQRYADGPYPV